MLDACIICAGLVIGSTAYVDRAGNIVTQKPSFIYFNQGASKFS